MAEKTVVGGSSVTAGQLKDFFRQIDDGSIGHDELRAFLERRNPFARTFQSTVDKCRLEYIHPRVESLWYGGYQRHGRKLYHFAAFVPWVEVEKIIRDDGWEPANLAELICYCKKMWNGKERVVALCESRFEYGVRYVPYLHCDENRRSLDLIRWERIQGLHSFLAVMPVVDRDFL